MTSENIEKSDKKMEENIQALIQASAGLSIKKRFIGLFKYFFKKNQIYSFICEYFSLIYKRTWKKFVWFKIQKKRRKKFDEDDAYYGFFLV